MSLLLDGCQSGARYHTSFLHTQVSTLPLKRWHCSPEMHENWSISTAGLMSQDSFYPTSGSIHSTPLARYLLTHCHGEGVDFGFLTREILEGELVVLLSYNIFVFLLGVLPFYFWRLGHFILRNSSMWTYEFCLSTSTSKVLTPQSLEVSLDSSVNSGTLIFIGNGGFNISRKWGMMHTMPFLLRGRQAHSAVATGNGQN